MLPMVSVIMSCYNEKSEWIEQSIKSILNQSYKNLEFIIVCDNPQNSELKKILLKYEKVDKRIKLIFNEINLGLTKSLNIALRNCSGDYIARMDADDISHLNRIYEQVNYLMENSQVDLIMSGINYINEKGNKISETKIINHKNIKKICKYGNISVHPTWMFKKEILKKIEGYHDIDYVEDYDFLCRLILSGYNVEYLSKILLDYRVRKNGITKSNRAKQEFIYQIIINEYNKALKNNLKYNALNKFKNVNEYELNKFIKYHEQFKIGKLNFKNGQYIKAIKNLSIALISSKIKRKQISNYIKLKIMSRFY